MLYSIPNVQSHRVEQVEPWEQTWERPPFENKERYRQWCEDVNTQHCFVSGFEGLNPHQRVSRENPPFWLHALVADYDVVVDGAMEQEATQRHPEAKLPNYLATTFSGNRRAIWLLDEPVELPENPEVVRALLRSIREYLELDDFLPALDDAFEDSSQYYEVASPWRQCRPCPLPASEIRDLLCRAVANANWAGAEGCGIPLEEIKAEIDRRFPGRLNGEFHEGTRVPLFWLNDGNDGLDAVVNSEGVYSFSTRERGFKAWKDILGPEFGATNRRRRRMEKDVEGIYFDGRKYYQRVEGAGWAALSETIIGRGLLAKGLEGPVQGGEELSEVQRALDYIAKHQFVAGAAPFIYKPEGVFFHSGKRLLNTSTVRVLPPVPEQGGRWGEGFAWTASFLQHLFDEEQLPVFLSWQKIFYESGYHRCPHQGQAIFVIGPVGIGKTFLSKIVGMLCGGYLDASAILLGQDNFNEEFFEEPLWVVDDDQPGSNQVDRRRFSALLKKATANSSHRSRGLYKKGCRVDWCGRILVVGNADPESLSILPDVGMSNADKVILLEARAHDFEFPSRAEIEATLERELPFFAGYLLAYEIPPCLRGASRFGMVPYHNPSLLQAAHINATGPLHELLSIFRQRLSRDEAHRAQNSWEGSASDLLCYLGKHQDLSPLTRDWNAHKLGIALRRAASTVGSGVEPSGNLHPRERCRIFRIALHTPAAANPDDAGTINGPETQEEEPA